MTTRTPTPAATTLLTGIVVGPAQVRTRPAGPGGRWVPVLCLQLQAEGACPTPIRIEQPFTAATREQCEAAARRFRPGLHVTVEAPLSALRLTVAGAAHIHPTQEPPDAPQR
jgi:hypothetical protein